MTKVVLNHALPMIDRDSFLTPFDKMFDQIIESSFPDVTKSVGVKPFQGTAYPKVNVYEYDDKIGIVAEIPGLKKDQLNIEVEDLPEDLRHIYFDMCVNQGRGRAVKIMQRAANAKGAGLKVDGGMGPKTIAAMDGVELDRVRAYRVKYYADLVTRKPDLEKFYFGWFRRALEV